MYFQRKNKNKYLLNERNWKNEEVCTNYEEIVSEKGTLMPEKKFDSEVSLIIEKSMNLRQVLIKNLENNVKRNIKDLDTDIIDIKRVEKLCR